jgi:signal transduction histidine kinase
VAILGVARDITDRKRTEDRLERSLRELRALSARLQNIREEEAARIARQVHDEIGQSLTALAMDVEWLTTNLGRRSSKTALSSKLQSMAQLVEATTEAVQRIASDLRPGVLDELGLGPAAEWAVRRFEERTGIASGLHSHLDGAQIDSARATAAFRILQEALTNIARHAGARRVEVRLSIRGPELHLEIQDDGVGIDTERIADSRSLGLVGMRERARVFGGSVAVAPAAGGGTLVSAAIPLRGPGRIV